jgi:hypothetical protein
VFTQTGAVLPWAGRGDLDEVIRRVDGFTSAGYPFAEERISGEILSYLASTVRGV